MKKIISIMSLIIVIAIGNISYSAEEVKTEEKKDIINIELNVIAPQTIEEGNNKYEITLSLGKFDNIEEGKVMAFQATLEYDENVIENIVVKGTNNWILSYSEKTKAIIGDTDKAKENQEIGKIEITLKEGITPGKNANIFFNNIMFATDKAETTMNKKVEVKIIEKKVNKQEKNNQTQNEVNVAKVIEDNTIANKIIPAAGLGRVILIGIIVFIILAGIFKFKSRKIKY